MSSLDDGRLLALGSVSLLALGAALRGRVRGGGSRNGETPRERRMQRDPERAERVHYLLQNMDPRPLSFCQAEDTLWNLSSAKFEEVDAAARSAIRTSRTRA